MTPVELVALKPLMDLTEGRNEIAVGLIDGPVLMSHPNLARQNLREVPGKLGGACARASSVACLHGTFVAGMLMAKRGAQAPAICPGCTLLVCPIFAEKSRSGNDPIPSATPEELAEAIMATVQAGARVLNLSAALEQPSAKGESELEAALNFAAHRGVVSVVAGGNQGTVGSTVITRHPGVIPVAACDLQGRPTRETNLSGSMAKHGLSAPSEGVTSLGSDGQPQSLGGTSAAAPFVTGTLALLWSEFPAARAEEVKLAVTHAGGRRQKTLFPPLLNAWGAYKALAASQGRN